MKIRSLRLALGLFFLAAGVGLLAFRFGMPEVAAKVNDPMRLFIGGILALVLAGLNLVRWYASVLAFQQQATPVRKPFQREPDAMQEEEPNPDFDFSKRTDETQPEK
jgi:hypothetical protein